jgi:transcriptional regulator
MYLPRHFTEERIPVMHDAIERTGLAVLVTIGTEGPEATHLPLLLDRGVAPRGMLRGHLARANPQWRALEDGCPALIIFSGPESYVSPSWYPSKGDEGKVVPTWNYIAIHAYGRVEVFHDPDRLLGMVSDLTDHHERGREHPWAVKDAPSDYLHAQLAGIVGFEMMIERLEGKWKMSQNRSAADLGGVVDGLRRDGKTAVVEAMG